MNLSDEIDYLADQIEEVIDSDKFLLRNPITAQRLKFLANNSLVPGVYARDKAHDIANYAEELITGRSSSKLLMSKIKERISRIRHEAETHRNK